MRRVTNARELNNAIPANTILNLRFQYVTIILFLRYCSMSEVVLPPLLPYIPVTEDPCRYLLFAVSDICAAVILYFSSDSHCGR